MEGLEARNNFVLDNDINAYEHTADSALDRCTLDFLKELRDYRDAEEQGLLLRLPCNIGDTVYYINPRNNKIESTVILRYWILGFKNFVIDRNEKKCSFSQFGKTVFLSEAEAKYALKNRRSVSLVNGHIEE
jgi:hypothetical protein